jgi:hypothetical protein
MDLIHLGLHTTSILQTGPSRRFVVIFRSQLTVGRFLGMEELAAEAALDGRSSSRSDAENETSKGRLIPNGPHSSSG